MRVAIACLLCMVLSAPAYAQKSETRQSKETVATFVFWSGISVASVGAITMATEPSVGTAFLIPGGGLIGLGVWLNQRAKQTPSVTFGVVPLKKGVAFGVNRSWLEPVEYPRTARPYVPLLTLNPIARF